MTKLTVILPAAGKGTRLNLPYPKEILRLDKHTALIDNSFDLFKGSHRDDVEFVVVINENKTEIVKYLAKYKAQYNISFTFQNPDELEYTGAIKSAKHLFGENNLVLLPDTLLTLSRDFNLQQELQLHLARYDFAFLFKYETDEKMLRTKGCLQLDNTSKVVYYEDKPLSTLVSMTDIGVLAFKREVFDSCIAFMEQSTLKSNQPKLALRIRPSSRAKH